MTLDEIQTLLDERSRKGISEEQFQRARNALDAHRKNATTLAEALRAARLSSRLLPAVWSRTLIDDLIRLLQPFAEGEAERLAAMAEDDRQYRVDNLVQALLASVYTYDDADDMRADYLDTIYRDADAVMAARERYIAARARR